MRCLIALLATFALATANAAQTPSLIERSPAPQSQSSALVNVTLHFKEPRLPELHQRMLDISLSGGAWLTDSELSSYITPPSSAIDQVVASLAKLGITRYTQSRFKDELYFQTTRAIRRRHFSHNFSPHLYGAEIRQPSSRPQRPKKRLSVAGLAKRTSAAEECADGVTPKCVRSLYNVSYIPEPSPPGVVDLAIMLPFDDAGDFSRKDLRSFLKHYQPLAKDVVVETVLGRGARRNDGEKHPDDETAMAVQIAAAQAWTQRITANAVGNKDSEEDLVVVSWRDFIEGPAEARPGVITTSWGSDEPDFSLDVSLVMCRTAMKLSALGTTIVAASGNFGVSMNGQRRCPPFTPDYYTSCPYVLGVGGTDGVPPNVSVAMTAGRDDSVDSAAGLSQYWEAPEFQRPLVKPYLASVSKSLGAARLNRDGRSSPDLVAAAVDIVYTIKGEDVVVAGNSAAAPLVASFVTLLNGARRDNGKGRLGWIQPLLYSHPRSFYDVVKGGSFGCGRTKLGFPAREGFDVASGLGSPLFSKLLEDALA